MRKIHISALGIALASAVLLSGCAAPSGGADAASTEPVTLKVAAVTSPMTDVVEAAADAIEDGYKIELVEVSDYVLSNTILQAGDVDANFSQHVPYLSLIHI